MNPEDIVIVAAKRTPIGAMLGSLSSFSATALGALAHQAVLAETKLPPAVIDEVVTGCVLAAGLGQAPARQAAIKAGIPDSVGAFTVNKMCGSGMKALFLAVDLIRSQSAQIVLASGMESMTNAPYLLQKARQGYRLGHDLLKDHLYLDGLEDAYHGQLMGFFAEETAKEYGISRQAQDAFAQASMVRSLAAQRDGSFLDEIVPIHYEDKHGLHQIDNDEGPQESKLAKIARLKPIFQKDGTVTAGNASSIADGAASLLVMTFAEAERRQLQPLAKIVAQAAQSQDPAWFTTAPVGAIQKVLDKAQWTKADVDLFEINEAFAVVALVTMQLLGLSHETVNVHGGACALGHPIGASGARIVVTLIHALKKYNKKRGIAALCIGGGEATALAIEVLQ